ncbi:hypothetical protein ACO0K0_13800 [Undibacterium sp. SXout11W]|uniref:hypothetical protein n=1 Tax=Undibacterium sp. SXout11W TaxID=3413050 RepID=UPI003BF38A10
MKKNILSLSICSAIIATAFVTPAHADEAALLQKIEKLAAELDAIKAELAATKQKTDSVAKNQQQLSTSVAENAAAISSVAAANTGSAVAMAEQASKSGSQTVISSYGEINYTRPRQSNSQAQTDVARAVIGITHRFDEKTKMVAEFEWEHAVTSKDDKGESEVEQLYVEHEIRPGLSGKAGLFLMPVGLLNTNHEPTAYYGVQRNFVETAIIPSTWREAGFGLSGTHDNGISWDAGLTTGFDINKWDATSTDGSTSPLGSIHQEGQLAKSRDLSMHAALNWRGVPGLLLGGSVFTGKAGQGAPNSVANDTRVTLWDMHARYNPGKLDLSALYARGTITGVAALNQTFAGQVTPVPSSFYGWYTQAAYQVWKTDSYSLTPFLRYEQFNTAQSYTAMPQGLGWAPGADQKVTTLGANFRIGEGVVLKADYQKFQQDSNQDRYNLGVGYSF